MFWMIPAFVKAGSNRRGPGVCLILNRPLLATAALLRGLVLASCRRCANEDEFHQRKTMKTGKESAKVTGLLLLTSVTARVVRANWWVLPPLLAWADRKEGRMRYRLLQHRPNLPTRPKKTDYSCPEKTWARVNLLENWLKLASWFCRIVFSDSRFPLCGTTFSFTEPCMHERQFFRFIPSFAHIWLRHDFAPVSLMRNFHKSSDFVWFKTPCGAGKNLKTNQQTKMWNIKYYWNTGLFLKRFAILIFVNAMFRV